MWVRESPDHIAECSTDQHTVRVRPTAQPRPQSQGACSSSTHLEGSNSNTMLYHATTFLHTLAPLVMTHERLLSNLHCSCARTKLCLR